MVGLASGQHVCIIEGRQSRHESSLGRSFAGSPDRIHTWVAGTGGIPQRWQKKNMDHTDPDRRNGRDSSWAWRPDINTLARNIPDCILAWNGSPECICTIFRIHDSCNDSMGRDLFTSSQCDETGCREIRILGTCNRIARPSAHASDTLERIAVAVCCNSRCHGTGVSQIISVKMQPGIAEENCDLVKPDFIWIITGCPTDRNIPCFGCRTGTAVPACNSTPRSLPDCIASARSPPDPTTDIHWNGQSFGALILDAF